MYFADTLSRAHSDSVEPNNLYGDEIFVASIDVCTDMLDCIKKDTDTDPNTTGIKKVHNTWVTEK